MATKKQIHTGKKHNYKPIVVSDIDDQRMQQHLQEYVQIARTMATSPTTNGAIKALNPISTLPDLEQVAFARALAKEETIEAANLLNGIYNLSPSKEARKEARRSLIRMEAGRIYPSWEPSVSSPYQNSLSTIWESGADTTQAGIFSKGFMTDSRSTGEVQMTLSWHEGSRVRVLGFLLDFWHDGVKDFFTRLESSEKFNEYQQLLAGRINTIDCTVANARQLIEEALAINAQFGTSPHIDYLRNLPLVRRLVLDATTSDKPLPTPETAHNFLDNLMGKRAEKALNDPLETFDFSNLIADEVAEDFLIYWSEGIFDKAYTMLSEHSPLREQLSLEAWVARRKAWAAQAQPSELHIDENFTPDNYYRKFTNILQKQTHLAIKTITDDSTVVDAEQPDTTNTQEEMISLFWSMILHMPAQHDPLPELPTPSLIDPQTGRQWFWATFTCVEEGDSWHILSITDEVAPLQALSVTQRQQQLAQAIQEITQSLEATQRENEDEDEHGAAPATTDPLSLLHPAEMTTILALRNQHLYHNDMLLMESPSNMELHQEIFNEALRVEQFERAETIARLALHRFPEKRVQLLIQQGQALKASFSTVRTNSWDKEPELDVSRLSDMAQQNSKAIIDVLPDQATGYLLLANALLQNYSPSINEEITSLLQKAQQLAQTPEELFSSYIALGQYEERRKNEAQALLHYQRANEHQPNDPITLYNIGTLQNRLADYQEAAKTLEQLLTLEKRYATVYTELAYAYTEQFLFGKAHALIAQALPTFEEADSQESEIAALLAADALTYIEEGKPLLAQEKLEAAETLDEHVLLVTKARKALDKLNPKKSPIPSYGKKRKKKR